MHGKRCLIFENPVSDAVSSVRFCSGSNNLLVSSWDCKLRLYDIDCDLLRLEAHYDAALLDCCFQDDYNVFSAASNGSIESCDLLSGANSSLGSHDDVATCVQYSHHTCQVVSAGFDKKLICWDTRSANKQTYTKHLTKEVSCMTLCGFDLTAAVGATINVFDLRNLGSPIEINGLLKGAQINCVVSTLHCVGYAVGTVDGRVALDITDTSNSGNMGYAFRCHPKSKDGKKHLVSVNDIAFCPMIPATFVTGDDEGHVILWNAQNKRRFFEFPRYPNSVSSLSYNNVGNLLAVATSYTYQEANELDAQPQIFVENVDQCFSRSSSSAHS